MPFSLHSFLFFFSYSESFAQSLISCSCSFDGWSLKNGTSRIRNLHDALREEVRTLGQLSSPINKVQDSL